MEDPIKVPAIGFSTTINVDGNRQIVFQGFFDEAETDDVVNDRLDRIMRLADRQRAFYEIPTLKTERQKLQGELDQYNEDVGIAETEYKKAQAEIEVKILEYQSQKKDLFDQGYADHVKRGKAGSYSPQGATGRNIELIEKSVEEAKALKDKNAAERQQFIDNIKVSIERRKAAINVLNEKIEDLEKVFGG